MGFWEDLKNRIFRKNKTALPEPVLKTQKIDNTKFNEMVNVGFTPEPPKAYYPPVGSLEFALQQYIYGLQFQQEKGIPFSSYKALTGICGMDVSNPGMNYQNEENFISKISHDRNVNLIDQKAGDKSVAFRHIQHGRSGRDTDTRLYVNCKRENIAALADKFYEEFGNTPYYFKFCSDQQASNTRRSEQFVFYLSSEPQELNRVIEIIERTRQKNPHLFEGAKNINPFMRDVKGYIGYAPNIDTDEFTCINGTKKPLSARSYNTLLGESLTDCFTSAIKDLVHKDYDLSSMIGGQHFPGPVPYINSVLKTINGNPEYQKQLIEKMKANLAISSEKNPLLSIRGLEQYKSQQFAGR